MGSAEQDLQTGRTEWSDQLFLLLGLRPGSVTPGPEALDAAVHPEDRTGLAAEIQRAMSGGGPFAVEVRLNTQDCSAALEESRIRTVAVRGAVEVDSSTRPTRLVATVQDITDRKDLERQLQVSAGRFRASFDQAPTGMALVDARPGRPPTILMANQALTVMTGRSRAELLRLSTLDLVEPPDATENPGSERPQSRQVELAAAVEVRLRRPDGHLLWVAMSGALVCDPDGAPDYYVTHLVDISDRKQGEAEARRISDRDQRISAVLQESLQPHVPAWVGPVQVASRYQPAGSGESVGGDWHDVFALPGGRIGLVVGDVAGHGIQSAATMARLRYAVRMLATAGASPAGVMTRLNQVVHDAAEPTSDVELVTLVHAQLDPTTGDMTYCSAGHMPLVALSAGDASTGRMAWPLPATGGVPIGVIPDFRYSQLQVTLEADSVLIGFTDGLIERRDHSLDDGLLALLTGVTALPAHTASNLENLADALLTMAPPGERSDDTAVIVMTIPNGGTAHAQFAPRPQRTIHPRHVISSDARTIDIDPLAHPPSALR